MNVMLHFQGPTHQLLGVRMLSIIVLSGCLTDLDWIGSADNHVLSDSTDSLYCLEVFQLSNEHNTLNAAPCKL